MRPARINWSVELAKKITQAKNGSEMENKVMSWLEPTVSELFLARAIVCNFQLLFSNNVATITLNVI